MPKFDTFKKQYALLRDDGSYYPLDGQPILVQVFNQNGALVEEYATPEYDLTLKQLQIITGLAPDNHDEFRIVGDVESIGNATQNLSLCVTYYETDDEFNDLPDVGADYRQRVIPLRNAFTLPLCKY